MDEYEEFDGYELALEMMVRDWGVPVVLAKLAVVAASIEGEKKSVLGMPIR